MNSVNKPKFKLGQTVATPAALAALQESNESATSFLQRHVTGDWGDLCEEDKKLNDEAIANEGDADKQQRVLSVYHTSKGVKLYIISEHDRSVSTILLPEEY